ncbi:MAG: trigger factor [Actinobacteria bacterium]|nr:trigger factor [Actinomycetota bacterium]
MASLTTSVEQLNGNKVKLSVAIPAAEFEKAVDAAFRKLAGEVKIAGFRPGKAPRQLLEARLGPGVAREQALRDTLPTYYAEAVAAEDIDVIAPPEIDVTAGEDEGEVRFDAVVEVRPVVTVKGYADLQIEVPAPEVPDDAVQQQIDMLRDRFADLEEKSGSLADGDFAQIDIKGYVHDEVIDALSATDFLYEVGSGGLVPKLDDELRGTKAGDILKFNDELPERFGERAGEEVGFQVLVKDAKRKVLPEVTDDWVSEVSELETVEELEADARKRLEMYALVQTQLLVRDKVLEAAAQLVDDELPDALVAGEMERRVHDLAHRLEHQGATIAQYLEATGQEQEKFIADLRAGSTLGVRADLALRAVVAQEGIEATDEEVDAEIARLAERSEEKPETVRKEFEQRGALEAVRSDIARGKALQFMVDQATVVDESGAPVDLSLPGGSAVEESSEPPEQPVEQESNE